MRLNEARARRVLGVGEHASAAEVTRAYRTLARRLHPDTGGATADPARFAEVAAAYRVLSGDASGAASAAAAAAAADPPPRRPSTSVRIPVRHVRRPGR
ncbi:MAG: J domain-containing protein [Actinomycetes bacterium]